MPYQEYQYCKKQRKVKKTKSNKVILVQLDFLFTYSKTALTLKTALVLDFAFKQYLVLLQELIISKNDWV